MDCHVLEIASVWLTTIRKAPIEDKQTFHCCSNKSLSASPIIHQGQQNAHSRFIGHPQPCLQTVNFQASSL